MPFVNPITLQLNDPVVHVQVFPPGDEVTVYLVITAPPFESGADQDTVTEPFPATPVTDRGAPGTVRGLTLELAEDTAPLPAAFVATTVKV